jgi:hypothetical protein
MADAAIEGMHERQAHLVDTGHTTDASFGLSEASATFPQATDTALGAEVATMVDLTTPDTPAEEDL